MANPDRCCHETPICPPGPGDNGGDPEVVSDCNVIPTQPPGPDPGGPTGPGGFDRGTVVIRPPDPPDPPGPGPGPVNPVGPGVPIDPGPTVAPPPPAVVGPVTPPPPPPPPPRVAPPSINPTTGGPWYCRCTITGSPTIVVQPLTGNASCSSYTRHTATWKTKCKGYPTPNPIHDPSYQAQLNGITANPNATLESTKGGAGKNCKNNLTNTCTDPNGKCKDQVLTWTVCIPRDTTSTNFDGPAGTFDGVGDGPNGSTRTNFDGPAGGVFDTTVTGGGGGTSADGSFDQAGGSLYEAPGNTPTGWTKAASFEGASTVEGVNNTPHYPGLSDRTIVEESRPLNVPTSPTISDAFAKAKDLYDDGNNLEELLPVVPDTEYYDREHTYLFPNDPDIINRATNLIRKGGEVSNNVISTYIPNFVNDVLRAGLGENVPFDGTTIGAYLYSNNTQNLLSTETEESLQRIKQTNTTSLGLDEYLRKAIEVAVYQGRGGDYSQSIFQEMVNVSRSAFPNGFPVVGSSGSRTRAFGLVRDLRQSLNNKTYKAKGNIQRMIQMYRIVAPDIDLVLPVRTASGQVTSAAIGLNNKLKVTKANGETEYVHEVNDFIKVRTRSGNQDTVGLKSNRDRAYNFDLPHLSVIFGHFAKSSETQYGFSLSVSSAWDQEVETGNLDKQGSVIKKAYLFTINEDSIKDIHISDPYTRKTGVEYKLVWKDGDPDLSFNDAIKNHSGPRNTIYVPVDDAWWGHFLTRNESAEYTLDAMFTDLDLDGFDGNVYPRRIPNDFLIIPTDKTDYNILQGNSTLTQYTLDKPVIRNLAIVMSPMPTVQSTSYVETARDPVGRNQDGRPDAFAFKFTMKGGLTNSIDGALTNPNTIHKSKPSPLGMMLNKVEDIQAGYNLSRGRLGDGIPQGDLLSRFTMPELMKYIAQTPSDVRAKLAGGEFNNVTIFPVKKTDVEKTFFTSSRLTDPAKRQVPKVIPKVTGNYFPPIDKGRIGGFK